MERVTITSTAATEASPPLTVTWWQRSTVRTLTDQRIRRTYQSGGVLPEGYPAGEVVGQDGGAHAECHSAEHQ